MFSRSLKVKYADYAPVFPDREQTAAQKAGVKFEKGVIRRLGFLYPKVEAGPWLHYSDGTKSGICQPDALVWLDEDTICIVECKLSHMRSARTKLLNFYGPIVQALFPRVRICYAQIYKNTKPTAHKRVLLIHDLHKIRKGQYRECQHLS